MSLENLETDFERAEYLQNLLISLGTGGTADNSEYKELRQYFLNNFGTKSLVPSFIKTNRDLDQFWQYIKHKFSTYAERRTFIWAEFEPILDFLTSSPKMPTDGAITAARTLLETVCKRILDERGIEYKSNKIDLPQLYHLVSLELNLSPSQYTEDVFKQILGGCSSIVNGLGTLRNRLGDAHGQGKKPVRPAARHAELAVNLAGSVALFLVETWEARNQKAG
jgi:hypothetical protein